MNRDLLMIVFYVDVRGLPATMLANRLDFWEKKYSMNFSKDIIKRYEIKTIFIPTMGETKVELLYPKVEQQEEKKLLERVIPNIPKEDKTKLNEGVDEPTPPPSQYIEEGKDPIINQNSFSIEWWKKIKNKINKQNGL